MELTKEEMWHIIQVMRNRGVSHCEFCKDLLIKLEEDYKPSEVQER